MNDTINNFLAAIEGRMESVMPGPWTAEHPSYQVRASGTLVAECMAATSFGRDTDAAFIAASRTDVPTLVDMLRTLIEEIQIISSNSADDNAANAAERATKSIDRIIACINDTAKGVA